MPDPNNPQSLNRYAYTLNNPMRYTDPTGNISSACSFCGGGYSSEYGGGSTDFSQDSSQDFSYTSSSQSYTYSSNYANSNTYSNAQDFSQFDGSNIAFVDSDVDGSYQPSSSSSSLFVDVVSIIFPPIGLARGIAEGINGTNVTNKEESLTPFEIGLGLATFGKGRATNKVFGVVEKEAQLLLNAPRRMMDHHLLPRQFQGFFSQRGIDIDAYTVSVGELTHLKGIHGKGLGNIPGRWNQEWAEWIGANPKATPKNVYQQLGRMMDRYHINNLPIHPYGK